jgi:hypothetical protein
MLKQTNPENQLTDEIFRALENEIETDFNGNFLSPSPTVFIGCGGMGKLIVNMKKKKLFKAFGLDVNNSNHSLPFYKFITIDSSEVDMEASKWHLTEEEHLQISWNNKRELDEKLRDKSLLSSLSAMGNMDQDPRVNNIMDELQDALDGCSQVRLVGRLSLFMGNALKNVADRIRRALQDLANIYTSNDLPNYKLAWDGEGCDQHFNWRTREKEKLRFVIISSLGGGQGTGIFIDVAGVIRGVLNEPHIKDQLKYNSSAKTFGLFVLPHCMETKSNNSKLRANSYAALKELNHFMSGNLFDVDYSNFDSSLGRVTLDHKKAGDRLFQGVFLFEGDNYSNIAIKHDSTLASQVDKRFHISDEITEFLMHCFVFSSCDSYWTLFPNKSAGDDTFTSLDHTGRPASFKTLYSSFGVSTLIYPLNTILKQIKNRWMKKIVNHLLVEIEAEDDYMEDISSMIMSDRSNSGSLIPADIADDIRNYLFQSIKSDSLGNIVQDIQKRKNGIKKRAESIVGKIYRFFGSNYGMILDGDMNLKIPGDRILSVEFGNQLNTLIKNLSDIRETYSRRQKTLSSEISDINWPAFYQICVERTDRAVNEKSGRKKKRLGWFSSPVPVDPSDKKNIDIDSGDLSIINRYLVSTLELEIGKIFSTALEKMITSLEKLLNNEDVIKSKRANVLEKLKKQLEIEKIFTDKEYCTYEDLMVNNLRSRFKYNLMQSSIELANLSNALKNRVKVSFDKKIDLRSCVTPLIRKYIIRKGGIDKCDESELYREINSALESYLIDFKFKEYFYQEAVLGENSFLSSISNNLIQFQNDMANNANPYIRVNNQVNWTPETYIVKPETGGHRNKLTHINIISGFSAHAIENLPKWRKEYSKMKEKHILQIFSDAEDLFPELAYVDRNIHNLDSKKFIDIAIESGYLHMNDNKITIRSLPQKTENFITPLLCLSMSEERLVHLLENEPAKKTQILDNYFTFMWSKSGNSFSWINDITAVINCYGDNLFKNKFSYIADKLIDMEIETEEPVGSISDVIRILVEHGFAHKKEDMVHLYVDTTVSDKAISCFINTTKEQLYREVKENKWFLEEVILKFCKFIQAEKRDEAGFVEKLRAYLDSERSNMPEILKIAIENKIYQADMMAAMEG